MSGWWGGKALVLPLRCTSSVRRRPSTRCCSTWGAVRAELDQDRQEQRWYYLCNVVRDVVNDVHVKIIRTRLNQCWHKRQDLIITQETHTSNCFANACLTRKVILDLLTCNSADPFSKHKHNTLMRFMRKHMHHEASHPGVVRSGSHCPEICLALWSAGRQMNKQAEERIV
jgi:hypothetical protein